MTTKTSQTQQQTPEEKIAQLEQKRFFDVLKLHLGEKECSHNIKDIVREATE